MEQMVEIYTDGACSPNPGKGGIGAVLISGNRRKEISIGYRYTTNNRMELLAVIESLRSLKNKSNVILYSDSAYIINAINQNWLNNWQNNGWKATRREPLKNIDLWKDVVELIKLHSVKFIWVKGHESNIENNKADELARNGALLPHLLEDLILEEKKNE